MITKTPDAETVINPAWSVFRSLLDSYHHRDCDVRLWDGSTWRGERPVPEFTIVLNHPGSLDMMLSAPLELSLGEAYVAGDYEIEGDLEAAFKLADHLIAESSKTGTHLKLGFDLARIRLRNLNGKRLLSRTPFSDLAIFSRKHSELRDRLAITYHYNLSNDFFTLWLDPKMVYSCAYFSSPDQDLASAQEGKLELICRKLQLMPGESFLDIGCGWGGLVIHAARHYGVRSTGITLSESQASLAREKVREAGLSEDQCQVLTLDYRKLAGVECYDKVASVGMVEHVGSDQLPRYFADVFRLLRPGGLLLNHGIAATRYGASAVQKAFFERYVFPDTEMSPLDVVLQNAEEIGFEIRHVESLRQHYVLTLRAWRMNLENHADAAKELVGNQTFRVWRLYLAASAYSFDLGHHNVFQSLLLKPTSQD